MKKYPVTHMVRMEDLNHHSSLYAGRAAEWLMEASFVVINLEYGKPHGILYRNTHSFEFYKPVVAGEIISYEGCIVRVGKSSVTMRVGVKEQLTGELRAEGYTTFVTVDPETKKPVPHGITLDFTDNVVENQWRARANKFFE